MSLGLIVALGLVAAILVGGLYAMLTNPQEIDAEEEAAVEEELKQKRRWWRR